MKNNFFYNFSLGNINAKPSNNSETLSQILYGEKFKVLKNKKNWVKIKTIFDIYTVYFKKKSTLFQAPNSGPPTSSGTCGFQQAS